jgi:hypothetical protein
MVTSAWHGTATRTQSSCRLREALLLLPELLRRLAGLPP